LNIVSDPLEISAFHREVEARTPGQTRLERCIQCGTCGGSCPVAQDMDYTPRKVFAMIRAGMEEDVLKSNTPFYCVSCYTCTVRCPQNIHITDIMYTLKNLAIEKGMSRVNTAKHFSQTFIGYVENNGRSFELGLATRQSLRHMPMGMFGTAAVGLGMLAKNRLGMSPPKIENIEQLQAILHKAKELEAAQ
jgi:heterodisulfide reductase subunit C